MIQAITGVEGHAMQQDKPIVVVTGSNGLIGSAVAERLRHDCTVAGLDLGERQPGSPVDAFFPFDLTSDDSVTQAIGRLRGRFGDRIASVIHLAAYYDFSGEPSDMYERVTVQGTGRLVRAVRRLTVEQFLFSSTLLVHAPCSPGQRIDEDWPLEPKWDYPQSKVETEALLKRERGDIPIVLMRIAGVCDDWCHSIPIAQQIQRIYERRMTSHVFPGDTSRGQPFVHLDDLVEACRLAVERRRSLPPELTVLVGEPETLSYDELQRTIGRLVHGEEWETTQIPKVVAKTGAWLQDNVPVGEDPFIKPWMIDLADDHFELDISRARDTLGWQPRHSLRDTLPRMISALKTSPEDWYRENKLDPPADAGLLTPAISSKSAG
jgi:nucleoside-diphosphate-sugar epimerase